MPAFHKITFQPWHILLGASPWSGAKQSTPELESGLCKWVLLSVPGGFLIPCAFSFFLSSNSFPLEAGVVFYKDRAAVTSCATVYHVTLSLPIPSIQFVKSSLNISCLGWCFSSRPDLQELEKSFIRRCSRKSVLNPAFLISFFLELRLRWKPHSLGVTETGIMWRIGWWVGNCGGQEPAKGIGTKQNDRGWRQGCCENTCTVEALSYYGDVQHRIHHWGNESCPHSKAFTQYVIEWAASFWMMEGENMQYLGEDFFREKTKRSCNGECQMVHAWAGSAVVEQATWFPDFC